MDRIGDFLTRRGFERRTRELVAPLRRTALALTGNMADADDLVQDAYVKAFLAFREGEFSSGAACRAWLYRITVNAFRDMQRRRLRRAEVELVADTEDASEPAQGAFLFDAPGPDLVAEANLMREALQAAVQSLPTEIRIATVLFLVHGMKYKDIASATDCPIGTVAFRIARGRTLLKQRLAEGWRPDLATTSRASEAAR